MLPEALLRTMGHPAAGGCECLPSVLLLEAILISVVTNDINDVTTEGHVDAWSMLLPKAMLMSMGQAATGDHTAVCGLCCSRSHVDVCGLWSFWGL